MKFHSFAFNPWTHEAMGGAVQRQVFCRAGGVLTWIWSLRRCRGAQRRSSTAAIKSGDYGRASLGLDAHPRQKRSKAPPRRSFTSRSTSAVVGSQPARDRLPYLSVSTVEMTSRKWVHL